jgi:hypothetical protein
MSRDEMAKKRKETRDRLEKAHSNAPKARKKDSPKSSGKKDRRHGLGGAYISHKRRHHSDYIKEYNEAAQRRNDDIMRRGRP